MTATILTNVQIRQPIRSALAVLVLLHSVTATAADTFVSDRQQVALLELYTSEGCSSCPPADRWFSSLKHYDALWNTVVPVAFHVDYWDYIGWKDRYSRPEYGDRQRRYARENDAAVVYTPGVMLNGKEWSAWRSNAELPTAGTSSGTLSLEVGAEAATMKFRPQQQQDELTATVVWLAFDQRSDVIAGENRGRVLRNDFVVMKMDVVKMQQDGEHYSVTIPTEPAAPQASITAVAGWVSTRHRLQPLQAVGGWLEGSAP